MKHNIKTDTINSEKSAESGNRGQGTNNPFTITAPESTAKENEGKAQGGKKTVEIGLSKSKYPESTKHIQDAISNGQPDTLTINRSGAKNNRKASLKGIDKVPGADLDEYPPAMFKEGGSGASVRPISLSDNRGAGSTMGHALSKYPEGTKVRIKNEN